jgi:hypothetical protein
MLLHKDLWVHNLATIPNRTTNQQQKNHYNKEKMHTTTPLLIAGNICNTVLSPHASMMGYFDLHTT